MPAARPSVNILKKIVCIKNVGRFSNCSASGDVTFNTVTLLFAENGRGKTTLCDVLRSLSINAPALLIGRETLGQAARPEVQLLFTDGAVAFKDLAWSRTVRNFEIFDRTFVNENVFAGDVIDTTQRRNLYRVIVGAQGVTLAQRVSDLDGEIRNTNAELRESRAKLQAFVPVGMELEEFINLPEDAGIDAKIAAKKQELQAVQHAGRIEQRSKLAAVLVPALPPAFSEILGKTMAQIASDVAKLVEDHVARHNMKARGAAWVTEGLGFITDNSCPFCGESTASVPLIQAYQQFFGQEYSALKNQVDTLLQDVDRALGDATIASIERAVLLNESGIEFWDQYCDLPALATPPKDSMSSSMREIRDAASKLIRQKQGSPLDTVAYDDTFTKALAGFEALRNNISDYNASVAAANALIEARKQATRATDSRDVEAMLGRLNGTKNRRSSEVVSLCDEHVALDGAKQTLVLEKESAKEQLDAHTQLVIERYGRGINLYLERINAGFRITEPTHSYQGGQPRTDYQIVINQKAVPLGDADTPPDKPSFRNTLSSGDRGTLALAFFLAQLENDGEGKIVVFDDPFTSLDAFRRSQTTYQILKTKIKGAQLIVLSHEASFLKGLWDQVPTADRKTLQLARVGEINTVIVEWDIEKAVQGRYRGDIEALQRFLSDTQGNPRDVIGKLRPVLEGFCRNLYPVQFADDDTLGDIVGKIREGGAAYPLHEILDSLDELNVYCRRYHHADNPKAATEPIDDNELLDYIRKTLKIVGGLL